MNEKQAREAVNSKATVLAEDSGMRIRGRIIEVDTELDGTPVACVKGEMLAIAGTDVEPYESAQVYYFATEDVRLV